MFDEILIAIENSSLIVPLTLTDRAPIPTLIDRGGGGVIAVRPLLSRFLAASR